LCLLMTSWFILRMRRIMQSIWELSKPDWGNTSCMLSLANVSFSYERFLFLVMCCQRTGSLWIRLRCKKLWIGKPRLQFMRFIVFLVSRLLSSLHSRFLQNSEANDEVASEGWEVCVDSRVWSCFSHSANFADYRSYFGTTQHRETFWCVLWCIWYLFGMCSHAGRLSHCLCLMLIEEAQS
jgi:hypothetical protein